VSEPGGDDVAHAGEAFLRFNERELRQWPLAVRCTVELVGTFLLTLVAAGPGVINAYVGGAPIGQAAAVIAPGALVMAFIYAWGPLSGFHVNPAVTLAFAGRGVFARACRQRRPPARAARDGANAPVVIASMLACIVMFVVLMIYVVLRAPAAAWIALLGTLILSFVIEVAYRRVTGRRFARID